MKRFVTAVLAATLMAGLTACGGGSSSTSSSTESASSPLPSPSPTPTRTARAVPDVNGKLFLEARAALSNQGFSSVIVGKDGSKWTNIVPNETVSVVSTNPTAGTSTSAKDVLVTVNVTEAEFAAAGTAATDAAKLAKRYKFFCGSSPSSTTAQDTATYRSFKEVWPTPNYTGSDTCLIKIDGYSKSEKPRLNPAEQAVVDTVAANGGDVTVPSAAYFTVLELCTKLPLGYVETFEQKADLKKSTAKAALAMCPDAPHAAVLQEVITAVKISDGTYIVGETMQPGTYKTKPGVKDCYWTRNAGGGDIIDNDFVSFAPDGVTVTVRSGEGFISERCGIWTKTG